MAATFQQLITRAWYTLKDDGTRWPASELLDQGNMILGIIKRRRPSLFFGTYGTPLPGYILGDTYPLAPEYEASLVMYLIAFGSSKISEFSEERLLSFFNLAAAVTGGAK